MEEWKRLSTASDSEIQPASVAPLPRLVRRGCSQCVLLFSAVFWLSRDWGEPDFGEGGHRELLPVGAIPMCRCLCALLVGPSTGTAPPGLCSSAQEKANSWFGRVSRCAAHLGRGQGAESLLHCLRALQVSSALV